MFNTGDIVLHSGVEYTVSDSRYGEIRVVYNSTTGSSSGWMRSGAFTLATPAKPVFTGMTQFYKDMENKYATSS